jgi:hypothetical protein
VDRDVTGRVLEDPAVLGDGLLAIALRPRPPRGLERLVAIERLRAAERG